MTVDDQHIRDLIERWAAAVHAGDLDAVLADHADDIVMFDVPPPDDGVRGIDAYRETWPPFFQWQAQGASFEIVSLDVTAGDDVAFAHALLRCGMPDELTEHPERRLRLTIGLRKQDEKLARHPRTPLVPQHGLTDGTHERVCVSRELRMRSVPRTGRRLPPLGDLDEPLIGEPEGDLASHVHLRAPRTTADGTRRVGRTDRTFRTTVLRQRQDRGGEPRATTVF